MNRPERRDIGEHSSGMYRSRREGYNKSCDEWEAWLPSEEELVKLVSGELLPFADAKWRDKFQDDWKWNDKNLIKLSKIIAKALSKRIRGEK